MRIEITKDAFDPWQVLSGYRPGDGPQAGTVARAGKFGALAIFIGTMRDFNQGDAVRSMRLEHYPEMVRPHIERTVERAAARYRLGDALVVHRVGDLSPGDSIVLVAAWAVHRRDAYAANRYIMEELKSGAPFWKQESLGETTRWVKENTPAE